ncbi:MAG: isoleucine--tRNA ligase [Candidatus Hodarchaeota archaeon]
MSLAEEEEKILEYWDSINIIKLIIEAKKPLGRYEFTEGPPTANGLPGVHHVYARSIKDIILRFKFMEGYWVPRKAGWDTHGLPVELEVEKELGLKIKKDILDYGIDKFNDKCRESVFRYITEWEDLTKRMAFWLDMDNPYITCENYFMESIWWSLKNMFDRDLIYKGRKVVPFCPRCETPLSSHEIALGYENIKEESIYITFKLVDPKFEGAKIVAWTTTPWTLLSNVAIAANPDSRYSLVEYKGERLIIASSLIHNILEEGTYKRIREFFGSDLLYEKYEPLFPYFEHLSEENGFIIITGDFVNTDPTSDNISTGFVHIAPAFGEDDFNVGQEFELPFVQPIDEKGYFDDSVLPLAGKYFKIHREDIGKEGVWDTDKWVVDELKKKGKLFATKDYAHDYPFCWRCKRALLYYARESWFIAMSRFRDDLLETNSKVNWVPKSVGVGRFDNFLDNVRDWAISRERFWGTPLPIWVCSNEECDNMLAIGSYNELKNLSKGNIVLKDYHKPMIDNVIIPCPKCKSDMNRTPEVIDVWYDSGAAPFAQYHYPFENKELVENKETYPVAFVAEGMDQTRGWFYTLHAIATVVFGHNAFNNVVVNGIVLDGEGRKMSKSLGNTIDPWTIFNLQGSDALRWLYFVSGPPHKEKRLSIDYVKYAVSQFIDKYWNSYLLFSNNLKNYQIKPDLEFKPQELKDPLDKWAIATINSLAKEVKELLDDYLIFKAAEKIQNFINNHLSNWYLRLARKRFLDKDQNVYNVVYYIFDILNRLIAPFVPFLSERVFLEMQENYEYMKNMKSVHLMDFPVAVDNLIDQNDLQEMEFLINLTQDLRALREQVKIKVRQPIKEYLLYFKDKKQENIIKKFNSLLKSELNVKEFGFINQKKAKSLYTEELILNKGTIGKDFKVNRDDVEKYLKSMNLDDLKQNIIKGKFKVKIKNNEFEIMKEHFQIVQKAKVPFGVKVSNYGTILINTEMNKELLIEGFARDFIRNVQNIRKKLNLSRFKEKIIINVKNDIDLKKELGDFIDIVKEETGCEKIGKTNKGTPFSFEIQRKKINLLIEVIQS